jgi:hypothetical protein
MSTEISTGRLRSLVMEAAQAATDGRIETADSGAAARALETIIAAMKQAATLRPVYGEVLAKATREYAAVLGDALPRRIADEISAKEFKDVMRAAAAEHKEVKERVERSSV